jgi:phosphoribosylpyrophosphate synthetase
VQERFYFGDNVLPLFESGIPLLLEELHRMKAEESKDIAIAYPDEGAWKRFHGSFKDFEEVVCTKVRDGAKRIVRLKEGEPSGHHVVIVDDLVQSGGTLIECGKLLKSLGAAHVSAYVTHGVFPKESYKRFEPESAESEGSFGWRSVWITDSCPQTCAVVEGRAPFKILSLAQPIANALRV